MEHEISRNVARDLAVAIGNVLDTAPDAAKPILVTWRRMANRAADQLDAAIGQGYEIPLTGGGAIRITTNREPY